MYMVNWRIVSIYFNSLNFLTVLGTVYSREVETASEYNTNTWGVCGLCGVFLSFNVIKMKKVEAEFSGLLRVGQIPFPFKLLAS